MFFVTETYMDPVALTTLGVNAKTTDNPIGYFGTGLKYAIAVLLRNNHRITIKTKKKNEELIEYKFSSRKHSIRGKEFDIIQMNNTDLGFTTDLGKNWAIWMALRELYCNTIDESGEVFENDPSIDYPEYTIIEVQGKEFKNCWYNRNDYFLDNSINPTYTHPFCNIYLNKPSKYLYYRGIRIAEYPENLHSKNTYNLTCDIDLTEDRHAKYMWQIVNRITAAVQHCNDENVICSCITGEKNSFEMSMKYDYSISISDKFIDVATSMFKYFPEKTNRSAVDVALNASGSIAYDTYALNNLEQEQLKKVLNFLYSAGYKINAENIKVYETLGENILGKAMLMKKEIFLSKEAFRMGNKQLAITILEEYFHLETNAEDFTRKFQDHILTELIGVHERMQTLTL